MWEGCIGENRLVLGSMREEDVVKGGNGVGGKEVVKVEGEGMGGIGLRG